MGQGKRYNRGEHKLNIKKVIAVLITLLVLVMFVIVIAKIISPDNINTEKKAALSYYTVYDNEKWGVINSSGETVIDSKYDEMILIPNPEKAVFIVTSEVNYTEGTYKSLAINENNENIFTNYDKIEAIQNHDSQNTIWYNTTCLKVEKNGKYGLIDLTGKILLNCNYESIEPIIGIRNSFITTRDGKKGLVSSTGSIIIENDYKQITALTDQYENGYIVKNDEGKLGVIGTNKKELLPVEYDDIKNVYSNSTYIAQKNNSWKIIDTAENTEIDFNYDDAIAINHTNIIVKKEGNYGVISTTGEELIAPEYTSLKNINQNNYIAQKDGNYGIIDTEEQIKLEFTYKSLTYIEGAEIIEAQTDKIETDLYDTNFNLKLSGIVSEINISKGYMKIRIDSEYKYYNFKFEEKKNTEILTTNTLFLSRDNGKYGFVDKNGVVVINYIYDDATEQNASGYVAVKKDGKWGAIDSKGKTVVEPNYTLENNPIIDFIGTWHLGEDINAGYYTK